MMQVNLSEVRRKGREGLFQCEKVLDREGGCWGSWTPSMGIAGCLCWTMKLWRGPLHLLQTLCAFTSTVDNTVGLMLEWADRCHVLLPYSTLTAMQGSSLTSWKRVLMSHLSLCEGPSLEIFKPAWTRSCATCSR